MTDATTYRGIPVPQPKCETVEEMCAKCPFRPDGSGYAQDHPDLPGIMWSASIGRAFYCHETALMDPRTTLDAAGNPVGIQPHFRGCLGARGHHLNTWRENIDAEFARREAGAAIQLGDVVHIRGFKKGDDKAHVVVSESRFGRVRVAYCAYERWYVPQEYAVEFVVTDLKDNAHTRRARRWLRGDVPAHKPRRSSDGWLRIHCGGWRSDGTEETVGHVDVARRRPW